MMSFRVILDLGKRAFLLPTAMLGLVGIHHPNAPTWVPRCQTSWIRPPDTKLTKQNTNLWLETQGSFKSPWRIISKKNKNVSPHFYWVFFTFWFWGCEKKPMEKSPSENPPVATEICGRLCGWPQAWWRYLDLARWTILLRSVAGW